MIVNADILMLNTAQIIAKANKANGGFASLNVKGLIPSQNQLEVNGSTIAGFETLDKPLNIMKTANSGWTTPQLNLSGSISVLNHNTIVLPNLNNNECNKIYDSSLSQLGKGGLPTSESHFTWVPIATPSSIQQPSNVIPIRLVEPLTFKNAPCTNLSL